MTDEFTTYDAAYLLGALSPTDRQAYEAHLAECEDCSNSVARLAGMPGLLGRVRVEDLASTAEDATSSPVSADVPPELLTRLLATVARRRRLRWSATLLAAAAAVVIAVAVLVFPGHGQRPLSSSPPEAMSAVAARTPIHATAQLAKEPWGTRILLRCTYHGAPAYSSGTYSLVVTDHAGAVQRVASWRVVPGRVSTVQASTSMPVGAIDSVQVRSAGNVPVLTLSP